MAYVEPVFGDADNPYPKEPMKFIDVIDTEGNVQNTIGSSEWFAEYVFHGHWRVNPEWQAYHDMYPPESPSP